MDISSIRGVFGLSAIAEHDNPGVSGAAVIGTQSTTLNLTGAQYAYAFEVMTVTGVVTVDFANFTHSGTVAWAAGTKQVETATAAGTITTAGNASVVVTAAGMTGSPKTISVAVALNDTAATWAGKVRTALAADTAVSALFDVGGTSTSIQLTRKAVKTFTLRGTSYEVRAANDSTLNISLDNGTCAGITTAATSTNTTSGVATAGYLTSGLGSDFQGDGFDQSANKSVFGILVEGIDSLTGDETSVILGSGIAQWEIPSTGSKVLFLAPTSQITNFDEMVIEPTAGSQLRVTYIGKDS
jgi:hypothetical protein